MRQIVGAEDARRKKARAAAFEQMAPGDEAPPGTEGTGEDVCPRCGGDGKVGGSDCPECAGAGTVIRGVGGA